MKSKYSSVKRAVASETLKRSEVQFAAETPDLKTSQAEYEKMFTVAPKVGQTWITKSTGRKLKIIAIANTSARAAKMNVVPTVMFRNENKELFTWPMEQWLTDNDVWLDE